MVDYSKILQFCIVENTNSTIFRIIHYTNPPQKYCFYLIFASHSEVFCVFTPDFFDFALRTFQLFHSELFCAFTPYFWIILGFFGLKKNYVYFLSSLISPHCMRVSLPCFRARQRFSYKRSEFSYKADGRLLCRTEAYRG